MERTTPDTVTTGRAILTDTEREYLRGEDSDQRMYEARSRLRNRIDGPLAEDVALLADHHPELLDQLQAVVCDGDAETTDENDA